MKQFRKDDTILLLIDHQVGTLTFAANRPKDLIVSRAVALAKTAKALGLPVVLTTSQEDRVQGPLLPELQQLLPEEHRQRIRRAGVTNAWNDPHYRKAVLKAAAGRKNVVLGGVTNDVCTVFPAISMAEEGFDVQVVLDAGGSPTQLADDIARSTWEAAGVRTTAINQLLAELAADWSTADGAKLVEILRSDLFPTIGKFA